MEPPSTGSPRTYVIRRSQHLGYGFIAGHEQPTMVKMVEQNGPSFQRLRPGDVIMTVNGFDVENVPREQIIKMIQLSHEEIEIKVRQPTYEEILNIKNFTDSSNRIPANELVDSPNNVNSRFPSSLNSPVTNYIPMNRLVTSISRQNKQIPYTNPENQYTRDSKAVLKQLTDNSKTVASKNSNIFETKDTFDNSGCHEKYGRHSPLPQRCKSSLEGIHFGKIGRKSVDNDDDQPMLKRSNTMRPMRPPAKVMEIFEVVIRIFFEDGHTRVLNYNQNTTVGVIMETLNARLVSESPYSNQIKKYFGLTLTVNSEESLQDQQMSKRKLLHILDENDSIMKIRQLPYAPKLRLLYRMIYPPTDVGKLYSQDKVVFEYLYKQSYNDLRLERFCPELDVTSAMKLAALHLVEYVFSNYPKSHGNSKDPKVYMKLIKKTPGIEFFFPISMIESSKDKKGKRIIHNHKRLKSRMSEQLKANFEELDFEPPKVKSTTNLNRYTSTSFHELSLPEFNSSPSDYVKLLFLNYLSQLPCYGNSKRPIRTSTSPADKTSLGDCSSSLESVPRTSDSSPLLRQENDRVSQNGHHNQVDHLSSRTITRLAQNNAMRSMNHPVKLVSSANLSANDQVDIAQTPSIESISSITFNMHSSPSPQQAPSYISQQSESRALEPYHKSTLTEPSPKPRQQIALNRTHEPNSIEKIYNQRYFCRPKPLDELLKNAILLPPPPASAILFNGLTSDKLSLAPLTPILTDRDLETLKVPPPPRIGNHSKID